MKISHAQYKALRSTKLYGKPGAHLVGMSEHGGFQKSTLPFLLRKGWVVSCNGVWKLTAEGARVLKENSFTPEQKIAAVRKVAASARSRS